MHAQGLIDVMDHLACCGVLDVLVVPVGVLVELSAKVDQPTEQVALVACCEFAPPARFPSCRWPLRSEEPNQI
jgi:hypothetical protein